MIITFKGGIIFIKSKFSIIIPAFNVERYLEDTLNSLINQSYQNFEAIIINDGSTDSTQKIIDEYCGKYPNFFSYYQENQGVASARNKGIELAKGKYIGFLDGDDAYPKNTLEVYNETIESSKTFPDILIGQQVLIDPWRRYSYVNAEKLSNEDNISPMDKRIIWTMSLCNKVFLREKIKELNLSVPLLSYAEDGAFLLPFVYSSNLIIGCPYEVLYYKKRVFNDYSTTQTASMNSLKNYIKASEIIHDSFIEFVNKFEKNIKNKTEGERKEFQAKYLEYLDNLLYRQCSILIEQFYMFFWRVEENVLSEVLRILYANKLDMFPRSWDKLKKKYKTIDLDNLTSDHEVIKQNPYISIVIHVKDENIDFIRLINNLYNSLLLNFEVIISEEKSKLVNDEICNRENFHIISHEENIDFINKAVNQSKGDYLLIIDQDIFISQNFLKNTYFNLKNTKNDFISLKMFPSVDDSFLNMDNNVFDFSPQELIFNSKSYDHYDYYFCNKLIKKEFLKRINFKFTNDFKKDIQILQEKGLYKKLKKKYIISLSDEVKSPLITIAIDNIDVSKNDFDLLIKSIYNQSFKSFEVILNEKLSSLLDDDFLDNKDIKIMGENKFKNRSISMAKGKYILLVDIPVFFENSALKDLFNDIEKFDNLSFSSSSIFNVDYANIENNKLNDNENKLNNDQSKKNRLSISDKIQKKIHYFSSQELCYSDKHINNNSLSSIFNNFDPYLSNKLISVEYLKKNQLLFEDNEYEFVLNLYKTSKFSKIRKKIVFTKLNQNKMFFSIKKLPTYIKIFYNVHKIFFAAIVLRRSIKIFFKFLKNGGR